MKKKIFTMLVLVLCACAMCFAVSCGGKSGATQSGSESVLESGHVHDYSTVKFDANGHWTECSCKEKTEYAPHTGGTATCLQNAVCSVCAQEYGYLAEHNIENGSCTVCGATTSQGLAFELGEDQSSYTVVGIGSCEDVFVIIPQTHEGKSVTAIADSAFEDCYMIEGVYIPDTVTSIGESAFENCLALVSVRLGRELVSIGNNAFMRSNIQSVEIPAKLETIGLFAFYACNGLTSFTVAEGNACFKAENGDLYSKDGKVLVQYAVGKNQAEFTTPSGLEEIGEGAFGGAEKLAKAVIANGVTRLGDSAFYGCLQLSEVSFGADVLEIGDGAFCSCVALRSVNLNNGLVEIGDGAFRFCSSLQSVSVPNSIVIVGEYAFADCQSLSFSSRSGVKFLGNGSNAYAVAVKAESTAVTSADMGSLNVKAIAKKAFFGCTSLTSVSLPSGLLGVGVSAFEGCTGLESVSIPNSTVYVGESAFAGCSSLAQAEVGTSLLQIHDNTFLGCSSLKAIELSDNIQAVGDSAFKNCTGLEVITIGKDLAQIGEDVFYGCDSLLEINVDEDNTHFVSDGKALYTADFETLIKFACGLSSISYEVNGQTKYIAKHAFRNSINLQILSIQEGIRDISASALEGCTELIYNEFGGALYLGCNANGYVVLVKSVSSFVTEQVAHPETRLIMENAFAGCAGLTKIYVGKVANVGDKSFYLCSGLQTVYYHGSQEQFEEVVIGEDNSALTGATIYFYSETEPALEQKDNAVHWHFVDDEAVIWDHNYWKWTSDAEAHWYECDCGARDEASMGPHVGGTATCTEQARCESCGESYGDTIPHTYSVIKNDQDTHWYECECGAKNDIAEHVGGTATCTAKAVCSVCSYQYGDILAHEYTTLSHDATTHWYECVCGAKDSIALHLGGTATCTEKASCEVCSAQYGDLLAHEYTELKHNADKHWYECECGAKDLSTEASHSGGTATCTEKAVCSVCSTQYGDFYHEYTELKHNADKHWYECECGAKNATSEVDHFGGTATCVDKAVCSVCNVEYGDLLAHEYDTLKHNSTTHWYECVCGDKKDEADHFGGEATCTEKAVCTLCGIGYGRFKAHEYTVIAGDASDHWYECECGLADPSTKQAHFGGTATCTEQAECDGCGASYGNLIAHEYTELKHDGNNHWYECYCGHADTSSTQAHFGGTATCTEQAECDLCGASYGNLLDHSYTELKISADEHWYECTCGHEQANSREAHFGGTATCTEKAECEVCGTAHGELLAHSYTEFKHNADTHWYECTCGKKDTATEQEHDHSELKHDDEHHWLECECSHRIQEEEHSFNEIGFDADKHWLECNCGAKDQSSEQEHGDDHFGTEKEECPHCPKQD